MQLKQLDLCSGIGVGFPLAGLRLGGFDLVGLCERDEYCRDILIKRFPSSHLYTDIRTFLYIHNERKIWEEEAIDIITATPPCQSFSVQGHRRGADDERDCFPAVICAISEIKPKFFCIENVRGLLSCPYKPGFRIRYFAGILDKLSECGYDAEWQVVSSGMFTSLFLRERVLLVGISRSLKFSVQPTAWTEQIRESVEKVRSFSLPRGGCEPGILGGEFRDSALVVRPVGVKVGDPINRRRREALGNCLDPRVAKVALRRVLYLNSLMQE
jgi:DNA (cytosine-5)-methyltransferase 1